MKQTWRSCASIGTEKQATEKEETQKEETKEEETNARHTEKQGYAGSKRATQKERKVKLWRKRRGDPGHLGSPLHFR